MINPKLPTPNQPSPLPLTSASASASAVRDPQTYAIIGAALAVHQELGRGFVESVYQDALEQELLSHSIPFQREYEIPIFYKGQRLKTSFRCDFLCFGEIIVELKALLQTSEIEDAQVLNYLKATKFKRGLLLNFGAASLEKKRFANDTAFPSRTTRTEGI